MNPLLDPHSARKGAIEDAMIDRANERDVMLKAYQIQCEGVTCWVQAYAIARANGDTDSAEFNLGRALDGAQVADAQLKQINSIPT